MARDSCRTELFQARFARRRVPHWLPYGGSGHTTLDWLNEAQELWQESWLACPVKDVLAT
jgi:hypothetical protein